jgi:FkbM family methyltransferase
VPELIKSRIRGRLYGYRSSKVNLRYDLLSDRSGLFVMLDERIKLRINEQDQEDFAFHFVNNGASVEEMYGFIDASRSARVLFDVGAHKGLFSLVFCALNNLNRAIAYEPSPALSASARTLASMNEFENRMTVLDYAIGQIKTPMSVSLDSSEFIRFEDGESFNQKVQIEMTTLDDECERLGIYPDIIKIDIEGYEYEALSGARNLLMKRKPVICLELHLDMLEQRGINPRLICDDLSGCGYRFFSCLGKEMAPPDVYDSANAVLRFIAK